MIIYAVDDERGPLMLLGETIAEVEPHANVVLFQDPMKLLREAEDTPCDVAFLDIQMSKIDGLFLAKKLIEEALAKNIIFVTSFEEYALDAMRLYASGYIVKPAMPEDIRDALAHLRVPVATEAMRIKVRTFGGFEVSVDGKPVKFKRKKSQELLAYLIDKRGEQVDIDEVIETLWENEPYDESRVKYLRILLSTLRSDLKAAQASDMLDWIGAMPAIKPEAIWCDAYELLGGDPIFTREFKGNYLPQYSWAEPTNALLSHKADLI